MTLNDIIQWGCIIVIFIIIGVMLIRKIVNAVSRRRDDDSPFGCGCGCSGCPVSSPRLDKSDRKERHDRCRHKHGTACNQTAETTDNQAHAEESTEKSK